MEEPSNQIDYRRFRILLEQKCNDALNEEETSELDAMVAISPAACEEYWNAISMHADLEWELSRGNDWSEAPWRMLQNELPLETSDPTQPTTEHRAPIWPKVLAASLLVATSLGVLSFWSQSPKDPTLIGYLRSLQQDSRWSFGRTGEWNGDVFRQGDTISLEAGQVELTLLSNTKAVLNGPLVMQAISDDRLRLHSGRVKVDVAKGDEGFTVETASAEVIDLGTVFAVGAENNGTNLVVFDGEVDLRYGDLNDAAEDNGRGPAKRFRAGQAVHVDRDGTLSRIANVRYTDFSPTVLPSHASPLISAVSDNIVRDDMYSFYEIVPDGLEEDAKAYVDRMHEWNGWHERGVPPYLLGADYVKTFCDDKLTPNLRIEVELQNRADVYVFLDDRLSLPPWLVERFEDTGDDIGIDESWPDRGHDPKIGPGKGIERTFSIWKLSSVEPGIVVLGPNGEASLEQQARGLDAKSAMYGFAAKRVDDQ